MGISKHNNHIVPQFYLRQWCHGQKLYVYDFVHRMYNEVGTGGVGYIKDTYSDELEEALCNIENDIANCYFDIIDKLERKSFRSNILKHTPLLTEDEERILLKFVYLQKIRTITGRLGLSDTRYGVLDIHEALFEAERQNDKLLNIIENIADDDVINGLRLRNSFIIIFRISNNYSFWTSSNPVHYSFHDEIFIPDKTFDPNCKIFDSLLFSLSPRLKLCITPRVGQYFPFKRKEFLYGFDFSYKERGEEPDVQRIVNGLNTGLIQSYENQISISQNLKSDNISLDPRMSFYQIISKKSFTDTDRKILDCFYIKGVSE